MKESVIYTKSLSELWLFFDKLNSLKLDWVDFYLERNILTDSFPIVPLTQFKVLFNNVNITEKKRILFYWAIIYLFLVWINIKKNGNGMIIILFEKIDNIFVPNLFFSFDKIFLNKKDWFNNIWFFDSDLKKEISELVSDSWLEEYLSVYEFNNIYIKPNEIGVLLEIKPKYIKWEDYSLEKILEKLNNGKSY